MRLPQIEKEINGRYYTLIPFGAKKSLELTSKITGMLNLNMEEDGEINTYQLLTSVLGNPALAGVVEELCVNVTCEGKKINFDLHFGEYKKDLMGVVGMSLKENVMPFFDPNALEILFGSLTEDQPE